MPVAAAPRVPQVLAVLAGAVLAAASSSPAAAQGPPLRITQYTTDDGLGQNFVERVVQDRAGFLWVATRRGLQRFDGTTFVPYADLDSAAPRELSGSITHLWTDRRGRLWIGTAGGLFRTDPVQRRVASLRMGRSWVPDSAGRIWFFHDSTLMWVGTDDPGLEPHTVGERRAYTAEVVLGTTRDGAVWAWLAERGRSLLVRIDPASGGRRSFPYRPGGGSPVAEDRQGRVWAVSDSALLVLDQGAPGFRRVLDVPSLGPLGFVPDGTGFILVNDAGLLRLDSLGRVTERWTTPAVFGVGTLPNTVFRDADGAFWVGTVTGGLFHLDPRPPPFELWSSRTDPRLPEWADFVIALHERRDGSVWAGTLRGGAYRFSPDRGEVELFPAEPRRPGSLPSREVWAMEEDRAGRLWVSSTGGFCLHAAAGFRCQSVLASAPDITRDTEGWLWLALVDSGVASFDPASATPRTILKDSAMLASSQVHAVFADVEPGFLWIDAQVLWRLPIAGGKAGGSPRRMLDRRRVGTAYHDMLRDRQGTLWVGTSEGLFRWRGGVDRFEPVEIPELESTTVFSLAEDRKGRIWAGTAHGLVQYTPATGRARRYTSADGFMGGELNRRSGLLRRNGRMLFGGVHGITEFDPEAVVGSRDSSPVVLTRWRKVTRDGIREVPIDALDTLRIEPGDRAFTLEYVAISFATSLARRYRYRLEGLDDDWLETTARQATYSAPRPGHYRFVVQTAAGSEGEWSAQDAIELRVVPPWWATNWFRALAVLVLGAVLWVGHRWRLRHVLATERLRLRISRDLHDEIGAGLSGLALLSDSARTTGSVGEPERAQLERIGSSARAMAADLRDIVWAIDPEADRLDDVVTRMKDVAGTLLRDVRLRFEVPASADLPARIGMSARRDLLLAYKEMLHNVAKHAHATEVEVALVVRAGALELTVSDNGTGPGASESRNGTGLRSLSERARRLGGQFELLGRPGGGTTARLRLPT
ncbi:MAG: sensor histidine kinase [Gemmatimonadales bacterium]